MRLVVTFHTATEAAVKYNISEAETIKQYGRRLVLNFGRPVDLPVDAARLRLEIGSEHVERIEMDSLVDLKLTEEITVENITVTPIEISPMNIDYDLVSAQAQSQPLWNLLDSEPYSIHAENVWKSTNSTPDIVVAVIDTGLAESAAGAFLNLAPGYDFVSDDWLSLDEDGRDPDPTDPGDWGADCPISSWHGTRVASVLAAKHEGQISRGVKGVAQNATLMPIRVLGLCRMGYASDVSDAIVWAAGGVIDGVRANPTPASVISMSFAGAATCPSYLQSAITQAIQLGSILIAAAGNEHKEASSSFPGNCEGVITVAASTREGGLAAYSNFGPPVLLAAPGGDASNAIMTLSVNPSESGLEVLYGMGTSFAVPHVSGVVALTIPPHQARPAGVVPTVNTSLLVLQLVQKFNAQSLCDNTKCGVGFTDAREGWGNKELVWSVASQPPGEYFMSNQYIAGYYCIRATTDYSSGLPISTCQEYAQCRTCEVGFYLRKCGAFGELRNPGTCESCLGPCDLGRFASSCTSDGNPICTPCPAGTVWNTILCKKCPSGKYSASEGMYVNSPWDDICYPCPTGTKSGEGASSCDSCLNGYVPITSNPLTCAQCPAGQYLQPGTSSPCIPCPNGTFARAGDPTCSGCAPGKFSLSGAAECTDCLAGTYSASTGRSACSPCPAGTASSLPAQSVCPNCPPNKFSATGSTQCTDCSKDPTCFNFQYNINCNSTTDNYCATCSFPPDATLNIPVTSQCLWICKDGFYLDQAAPNQCTRCTTSLTGCTTGQYRAQCTGGQINSVCTACTNKPLNSVYTGVSRSDTTSDCPYACAAGYTKHPTLELCCLTCNHGFSNTGCSVSSSGVCNACSN